MGLNITQLLHHQSVLFVFKIIKKYMEIVDDVPGPGC